MVWMFHNRTLNNKINRLHERALRIVYKEDNSTFQDLLQKDKSVTIHEKNVQKLATQMFKIKNKISPTPMQDLFKSKIHNHELRNKRLWESSNVRTSIYGTETITYMGPKIWELVPDDIKRSQSLIEFKRKIKMWKPEGCSCKLCKIFVPELGYL